MSSVICCICTLHRWKTTGNSSCRETLWRKQRIGMQHLLIFSAF